MAKRELDARIFRDHSNEKIFFKIGEAAKIVGVEPYVLRFWETEFSQIRPRKSTSGQRNYRKQDLEVLLKIKELLYINKMSLDQARKAMRRPKSETSLSNAVKGAESISQGLEFNESSLEINGENNNIVVLPIQNHLKSKVETKREINRKKLEAILIEIEKLRIELRNSN